MHICSVIGGVLVILGLYMLLWGKDKDDQEHKAGKEHQPDELDCEKLAATVSDHFAARNHKAQETATT